MGLAVLYFQFLAKASDRRKSEVLFIIFFFNVVKNFVNLRPGRNFSIRHEIVTAEF